MKSKIYLLLFLLPLNVWAQKGLNDDVTVVRPYKPVLADAVKISGNPEIAFTSTKPTEYKYDAKLTKYDTIAVPKKISAEEVKSETIKKLYRVYAVLGFGNYLTPFADVYVNNIRSRDTRAGARVLHHSSHVANNSNLGNFSQNRVEFYGSKVNKTNALNANLSFDRKAQELYAYKKDPSIIEVATDYKNIYNQVALNTTFASNPKRTDTTRFRYFTELQPYYLFTNNNATEANITVGGSVLGKFQGIPISLGAKLGIDKISQPNNPINNNTFDGNVAYNYKDSLANIQIGLKSVAEYGAFNKFHIYPNIQADYELSDNFLTVYGGITGGLTKNTLQSIYAQNPFVTNNLDIKNTNRKLEFFGGLRLSFNNTTGIRLNVKYTNIENVLMYGLDTNFRRSYVTVYSGTNGKLFSPSLELIHQSNEKLRFLGTVTLNNYKFPNSVKAQHLPTLVLQAGLDYNIGNKFYLNVKSTFQGGRKAYDKPVFKNDIDNTDLQYISVKDIIDLSAGIDYRYSKIISIYIKANNITSAAQSTYLYYPSYGFNGLIGITFAL